MTREDQCTAVGVESMNNGSSMVRMWLWAWLFVLVWAPPATGMQGAAAPVDSDGLEDIQELFEDIVSHASSDGFFTWVDEQDNLITYTAIAPAVGDSYINADNKLYEVETVADDKTVRARFVEQLELPRVTVDVTSRSLRAQAGGRNGESGPIGIYHSHNAESYVPTSNEEFTQPQGDIVDVGRALKEALEEQGYRVVHSDNSHLPHDGGAYQRSRATVRELLEEGVVALIDVHRDAIPAEVYRTEVEGEDMTKVRLVVGRQNPNREANLELAKRIKAMADEQYPGLVKGIFNARGNYNQDIGPRTILLEFGTHETSLDEAVRSTKFLAEIFPAAAGLAPGSGEAADAIGGAGLRSAFWVALVAAVGLFGYLWINEGSPQGAWNRIRTFFRRETVGSGPSDNGSDRRDSDDRS